MAAVSAKRLANDLDDNSYYLKWSLPRKCNRVGPTEEWIRDLPDAKVRSSTIGANKSKVKNWKEN